MQQQYQLIRKAAGPQYISTAAAPAYKYSSSTSL